MLARRDTRLLWTCDLPVGCDIAAWTVEIEAPEKWSVANTATYGSERFRASDLIEQALNGRTPTAYDEHEDGSRTVNQQETIAAREKQQQLVSGG